MTKLFNTIGHEIKEIAMIKNVKYLDSVERLDKILQLKQNAINRLSRIIDHVAIKYPEILDEVID